MNGKLTNEQKTYVVRRLAEYDKPTAIALGLKEVFGVTISHQAVEHYDPERPAGHDLAQKWRDLFWQARRAFIESIADVGTMLKPVRMHIRERMALQEWEAGRCKIANEILDSIAKEAGGAFVTRHEPVGKGLIPMTATITHTGPAEPLPAPDAAQDDEEQDD